LAKLGTPGKGLGLVSQMLELDAQDAHFRSTFDTKQLAPLPWRVMAQRFHRSEPGERHEGKQQKDRLQAIKALGQGVGALGA
jgi:hypothetical protein